MTATNRVIIFCVVVLIGVAILGASYSYIKPKKGPAKVLDTYGSVVEPDSGEGPAVHTVGSFSFVNQEGMAVTDKDIRGKAYVADFFFTTCKSICIPMGEHMAKLQKEFAAEPRIVFLSHTVDPETDSVPVLKAYAASHHAIPGKWQLLTGEKKKIYDMARHEYFVTATQGDGGPDDFVHTQNFVLVDRFRKIRGYYDGTSDEEMEKLRKDIRILLDE